MLKNELRALVRQRKRQFTQRQLSELSLPIVERIKAMLVEAQVIVAYYSLSDEVDTHQLIDDLIAKGKTVYLPRVVSEDTMELCRYTGDKSLRKGSFGIMEPIGLPMMDYMSVDAVLVPGMAFDSAGHRLGRGKGYYDRFLASLSEPSPKLIGVCFDFQKVERVPTESYDVAVDIVI